VIKRDGLVIVDFDNMYLHLSAFQADREFRTAGISFDSDLYVRNLAFREPGYWVFWRMPAASGTNALSLDDIWDHGRWKWQPNGYWERGWTFTTTVSEVSFNIRVQSDFDITCYNSEDQPVQTRTVPGIINPNGTPRDIVWYESGADYPLHRVEMKGQGMKRCAFRSRGGIIDDLTFRPEQERKLELSRNADSIERGQPLNCVVSAKPNGELREIRWKFVDSAGHEIPGPQDEKTWGGPIVVVGRVHVSARIGEDSVMRKDTLICAPQGMAADQRRRG
jgi:hypothetical protein